MLGALLHNPKLLVLDEPTNGLDPEGIIEIRNLLKSLVKDKKMAIFISSHNLFEIENCCNKICIIKNGKILKNEKIEDLKLEIEKNIFLFEIDDASKIKSLNNFKTIDNTHIELESDKDKITEIIDKLRSDNVLIYEVKRKEESLEDAFLQEIGGNEIE